MSERSIFSYDMQPTQIINRMHYDEVERKCILVLGMHRSGTSVLTRVLSLFGAALPRHVMGAAPSNEQGHWEPERLVILHDQMLAEAGSRWDDWRAFDASALSAERLRHFKAEIARLIACEFGDAPLFLIKDPRICRFVPVYNEALASLSVTPLYVLPLRNPLAVVKSLGERDGMTAPFASLLWLRHVLDAEAATRSNPRAIISYERLLDDWQGTASAISARLDFTWPRVPQGEARTTEAFLVPALTHHAPSLDELAARADIAAWVKDAHAALLALEDDNGNKAARATLDMVRAAFDAAAPIFGAAIFKELRATESRLIERNDKLSQELTLRDVNAARQQAELETLRQQFTEQEATMRQQLAKQEAKIGALGEALAARDAELHGIKNSYSWRMTKPLRFLARLLQREST